MTVCENIWPPLQSLGVLNTPAKGTRAFLPRMPPVLNFKALGRLAQRLKQDLLKLRTGAILSLKASGMCVAVSSTP